MKQNTDFSYSEKGANLSHFGKNVNKSDSAKRTRDQSEDLYNVIVFLKIIRKFGPNERI